MKPDYGLELLRSGVNRDVELNFYGVPFQTIDFLDQNSYSAMLEIPRSGRIFAVSFDFDDDVFGVIISKLSENQRVAFGKTIHGKSFPFSSDLPIPVEATTLKCRLGDLQTGAHDSFIPLIVLGLS